MSATKQRGATGQFKCQRCGITFTARLADRARGWAKSCSKSCAANVREKALGTHRFSDGRFDDDGYEQEHGAADAHLFSNEEHYSSK